VVGGQTVRRGDHRDRPGARQDLSTVDGPAAPAQKAMLSGSSLTSSPPSTSGTAPSMMNSPDNR
jgi:hypothetical protein